MPKAVEYGTCSDPNAFQASARVEPCFSQTIRRRLYRWNFGESWFCRSVGDLRYDERPLFSQRL